MNVFFISYGKDSLAQLYVAKENGISIDCIVTNDIYFSKEEKQLAYFDDVIKFRDYADKKIYEDFGTKVKHISSSVGFKEQFYKVKQKGNHIGNCYGFPYVVGSWCVSRLKVEPMEKWKKQLDNLIECIGIAFDEPERYQSLITKDKHSVLYEFKITEEMAMKICEEHNLVNPVYTSSFRDGCWFCPKQSYSQLYLLWQQHKDKWQILEDMEKDSHNTFKPKTTLKELRARFESGYVPKPPKKCAEHLKRNGGTK